MISKSSPYHVYIVRCRNGSFYTGITNDLERRLLQHNGKKLGGAKYTQGKRPVELVYFEKYKNRKEASKREWEIKHTLSHQQKEVLISGGARSR